MFSIQKISSTHQDSILSQAALPRSVWSLAVRLMDLYENGMLKDQKLNLSSLMAKPEFKQQYLAPIRAMNEEDQCKLLNKVISKEISLNELKTEAAQMKSISALKVAFVRLTNAESWEKARETYPSFATEEQLQRYSCCNLKKAIPQSFHDFCARAKVSMDTTVQSNTLESIFEFKNSDGQPVTVTVVEAKPTEVSGHMINVIQPSFSGADLAILVVDEVCLSYFMCVSWHGYRYLLWCQAICQSSPQLIVYCIFQIKHITDL